MPLPAAQFAKFTAWCKSKGVNAPCPGCGGTEMGVDRIVAVLPFEDRVLKIGGETVPLVMAICPNCACVRFFSAVHIGLNPPMP